MIKYQIRYCDSKGNGHFQYVEVKSQKLAPEKSAESATEYLQKQRAKEGSAFGSFDIWAPFRPPFKPRRTIHVWEWDNDKKEVKKGGHRFKLTYCYLEATYIGGGKRRQEWYEPVISVDTKEQK